MSKTRKNYSASLKSRIALCALRDDATISELSSKFGIHSTVIRRWKKEAMQGIENSFKEPNRKPEKDHASDIKELHAKIGELTVENDFLEQTSKKLGLRGVKK